MPLSKIPIVKTQTQDDDFNTHIRDDFIQANKILSNLHFFKKIKFSIDRTFFSRTFTA